MIGFEGDYMVQRASSRALALEREVALLVEALWECMKHAGADTSYADSADHAYRLGHLPESAVNAVKELRSDYIEAGGG